MKYFDLNQPLRVIFLRQRKRLKLSQSKMAKLLGVTQGMISKIESGMVLEPGASIFIRLLQLSQKKKQTCLKH